MRSESHRRAHSLHGMLLRQQVNDGMRSLRVELGAVRSLQAQDRSGEADRRELEPEAHALERNLVLRGESGRRDLALDPAVSEAARDQDAVRVLEASRPLFLQVDRFDPFQFHVDARRRARMMERSEEHTSELQSQSNLVCRLLLEKKKIESTSN